MNVQTLFKQDKSIDEINMSLKERTREWEEKLHHKQKMIDLVREIKEKKSKDLASLVQKRETSRQIIWFREEQRRYQEQLDEINKKNKTLEVIERGYIDEVARQKSVLNEQIRLKCLEVRGGIEVNRTALKEDSPLRKMKQYQTGVGGSPSPVKKPGKPSVEPKIELKQV